MADPKPKKTKGAQALQRIVAPPRVDQEEVANNCEVTQQAVSGWVKGRAKPTPDRMRILQDKYGIPMESWTEYLDDDADDTDSEAEKVAS
ncbi:MAG: helix-turn-helix transcriptional regulator [Chthoniobacterales bacterium]|nr:helix-turn-helix transcriptional regulator [Chthoniobacterales bacterium]